MSEVYDYWSKEDWVKHVIEIESEYDRMEEKCDDLTNMLEDVVNELNLSEAAIAEHGQHGTPPAELVRLVLEAKNDEIRKYRAQLNGNGEVMGRLTAQVAVLREALEMSKAVFSYGFDENKPAKFFIGGIKCLNETVDQALSTTNNRAEKMLEGVRAAEKHYSCHKKHLEAYCGTDEEYFDGVHEVLVYRAVKAYKGE